MRNMIPWRRKREEHEMIPGLGDMRNEMEVLFDRFLRSPWSGGRELASLIGGLGDMPRTDVAETDSQVTVTIDLPGVNPEDVVIDLSGYLLTVRGEKHTEQEKKEQHYHFVERQFGRFERQVTLPRTIDPDKVDANYKNGVLTIAIDKRPDARAKRIEVRDFDD